MSPEKLGVIIGICIAAVVYLPISLYVWEQTLFVWFDRTFWTLFGAAIMAWVGRPSVLGSQHE